MRPSMFPSGRRGFALVAALATLVLVGAGCTRSAAPAPAPSAPPSAAGQPSKQPEARPPQGQQPTSLALGSCSNPYYPLRKGYKIEYQTTATGSVSAYSMAVKDAGTDSATLTFDFPDKKLSFDQAVTCAGGSVKTSSYFNVGGPSMKTETKAVRGELMPKDVAAGSQWTTTYQVVTTTAGRSMNMNVTAENKAIGEEQVTVPAGTFTALKVMTTTTMKFDLPGVSGLKPNVTSSTQWWVKGVGAVKTTVALPTEEIVTVATKVTQP